MITGVLFSNTDKCSVNRIVNQTSVKETVFERNKRVEKKTHFPNTVGASHYSNTH